MKARVTASNSAPVKFRSSPNGPVIKSIAQGEVVEVVRKFDDTWSEIEYEGTKGYMMSKFLARVNTEGISELKAELKKVLALLDKLEENI